MLPDMFTFVSVLVVLIEGIAVYARTESVAMSDEKRLIKHLLQNYKEVGIVGRPVFNTSDTVRVDYGFALIQILDLDEKNQVLTTNAWNRYKWTDILLRWNPEDFGGVAHVRVPADEIWTPDIVLYNYADTRLKEQREAMAVVQNTGEVIWIPMAIFKSTCSIDITNFPFDEQKCTLKFGSWTYDGTKLDVSFFDGLEHVDIENYVPSNEWHLLKHPAVKNVKYYPCCTEPYLDLTFTIEIKRIAAFYSYILILPCVLLSSLTLVIFWLPPESPAKMMLGINIFVAFFVLLLLLADSTPPAAQSIPLIGAYFCLNMILITLSTFLSVIVINLYFRGDKKNRVPRWLKKIMVDGLARIMCMNEVLDEPPKPDSSRHSNHGCVDSTPTSHRKHSKDRKKVKCPELKYNKFQPASTTVYDYRDGAGMTSGVVNAQSRTAFTCTATPAVQQQPVVQNQALESDVREIKRILRTYIQRLNDKDAQGKVAKEWRIVARVLDRLFFFMYVATIIVSLATIFPKG